VLTIIFLLAQYVSYPLVSGSKGYAADDSMTISSDYTLEEDAEVGSLTVNDGTLDLNGHSLTVTGDFAQSGGKIDLNQGTLKITGDLNQSGGTLNTNKGNLKIDGSYSLTSGGFLVMLNDKDYFSVGKDFTVARSQYGNNNLQAGTIEVKGDFTQKDAYYTNFRPSGTHKVILSGDGKQTISFEQPSENNFNILKLTKPLPVGYIFSTEVNWNQLDENGVISKGLKGGDFTLSSDWKLLYDIEISSLEVIDGTLDLNGHKLNITGDVKQSGGKVDLDQGTLKIAGDLNQSGGTFNTNNGNIKVDGSYSLTSGGFLVMLNDKDYFSVGENFTVARSQYGNNNLQAGTIEVKGDFTQKDAYYTNFRPSGTHKVILSGEGKQTVSFDDPSDNYFNILEVTKPLLTGYKFSTEVNWVKLIQRTQNVSVTSISLDKTDLNVIVGDKPITLNETVSPSNATNKKVTWSSSNSDIAEVDVNGVVTPLAAGTATITVTTVDGKKIAKCIVTVKAKAISATGVKLDTNSLSLEVDDSPVKLKSTVLPANATDKNVTWISSDSDVASVTASGTVTPIGPGTAVITVKTLDGSRTATCSVQVTAETADPSNPSYTLDDFINDSELFNDILGEFTIDQIRILLPTTYIQQIKVTRNDALKVSSFEIKVDEDTVDFVNIIAGGKSYALSTQGDGVFKRSISGLTKGSEFIVKAYDENKKVVEDSVQRVIPMDYIANVPVQKDLTLQQLVDDTNLFNSLLDYYTLDQLKVELPKVYIQDAQTTYSTIATKIVVNTDNAITKAALEIKGQTYSLTNKGNGRFERAIAGLARGTTFKVKVYTMDGTLVEQKVYRVK
jgi:uncharacterized protein YjdB